MMTTTTTTRRCSTLFFLFCSLSAFGGEVSFFDPAFESLDASAIEKLSPGPVTELFLAEAYSVAKQPHAAHAHVARLREMCEGKPRGRAAYACAIERAESRRWFSRVVVPREPDVPEAERQYAEGRITGAVVPFAFLTRQRPDRPSMNYWLGKAYWERGNRVAAREAFARAPEDARVKAGVHRAGYGLLPAVFYTPARGLGARLTYFDDALFDTDRAVVLSVFASTRGSFGVTDEFRQEWVGYSGAYFSGKEDLYGAGPGASEAHSEISATRMRVEIFAHREGGDFRARVGAKLARTSYLGDEQTYFGPRVEAGYRNITLAFYCPRAFAETTLDARESLALGPDGTVNLVGVSRHLEGTPPAGEQSRLGGSFDLPGVREGRFRDRDTIAGSAEYLHRVWGQLRVGAFGVAGAVAPDYGALFSSPWATGGGVAIDPGRGARLELSRFGGETVVQARVTAYF